MVTPGQLVAAIKALPPEQPESSTAARRSVKMISIMGDFLGLFIIILLLWNRIIAAAAKRIAADHTPDG